MDARFKKEGYRSVGNAHAATNLLQSELLSMPTLSTSSRTPEIPTPSTVETGSQNSFLNFVETKIALKRQSSTTDAIISLRRYFESPNSPQDVDPLLFWKINSTDSDALKVCARRYLCVPASSTESERMFSKAGYLISDRIANLKEVNVDKILFVNKN
ncbi:uncharacterized protein LOC118754728 [Rhagoletis pomonella]|uniref:uncharacterized protein LOC118754728 n=1 Tax=Rhagoletis pomonella TaxID=28610 RepID=UPI0017821F4F|nr:uncharacterized protein LOC118754728 [Rhagoletis pomonella]